MAVHQSHMGPRSTPRTRPPRGRLCSAGAILVGEGELFCDRMTPRARNSRPQLARGGSVVPVDDAQASRKEALSLLLSIRECGDRSGRARDVVWPLVRHADWEVRRNALKMLLPLETSTVIQADLAVVVSCTEDKDSRVRVAALEVLEEFAPRGDASAVAAIAARVGDRDRPVRTAALSAIQKIPLPGDPVAVDAVVGQLAHDQWDWRQQATKALDVVVVKGDPYAIEAVVHQLESCRDEVRKAAADALPHVASLGDPVAVEAVAKRLENSQDFVRLAAARALVAVAEPGDHNVAVALAARLAHEDPNVRAIATRALRDMGKPENLPIVLAHLDHPAPSVRRSSLLAAKEIGRNDEDTINAVAASLQDDNASVRSEAVSVLANLSRGSIVARKMAVVAATKVLAHADVVVQEAGAGAIKHVIGEDESERRHAIDCLGERLRDRDLVVRRRAVLEISRLGREGLLGEDALGSLGVALRDAEPDVRRAAFDALAKVAKPEDVAVAQAIGGFLQSHNIMTRRAALQALATVIEKGGTAAVVAADLVVSRLEDEEADVREDAVATLQRLRPGTDSERSFKATSVAMALLGHHSWQVRKVAVNAVASLALPGEDGPISAIAELAGDSAWHVRKAVAQALGHLGQLPESAGCSEHAVSSAAKLVDDWQVEVQEAAVDSLERIAGKGHMKAIRATVSLLDRQTVNDWKSSMEYAVAALLRVADKTDPEAIRQVASRLESDDSFVRKAASEALIRLGLPDRGDIVEAISKFIDHPQVHVRYSAAIALGGNGRQDVATVAALGQLLEDQDAQVRQAATSSFRRVAKPAKEATVNAIMERLTHGTPDTREAALEALSGVADPGDPMVIKVLATQLEDIHSFVRQSASEALLKLTDEGDPLALYEVSKRLGNNNAEVRDLASKTILRLSGRKDDPDAIAAVCQQMGHMSAEVREIAAHTVSLIANSGNEHVLRCMLDFFEDTDAAVRADAVALLARTVKRGDVDLILKLVHRASQCDPHVRESAVRALGLLAKPFDPSVLTCLALRIGDSYPVVRRAAADALVHVSGKGDRAVLATLVGVMKHSVSDSRKQAIIVATRVANWGDVEAAIAIADCLEDEADEVRRTAIDALDSLCVAGDRAVLAAVGRKFGHPDLCVRQSAVQAFRLVARVGDREAIAAAAVRLEDESWSVRATAAEALAHVVLEKDQCIVASIANIISGGNEAQWQQHLHAVKQVLEARCDASEIGGFSGRRSLLWQRAWGSGCSSTDSRPISVMPPTEGGRSSSNATRATPRSTTPRQCTSRPASKEGFRCSSPKGILCDYGPLGSRPGSRPGTGINIQSLSDSASLSARHVSPAHSLRG